MTYEVYCLPPPSVEAALLSAVKETYCNKQFFLKKKKECILMSSTSFWTCPNSTTKNLRKKGAIFGTVEKE